jgi:hypothetical protein
MNTKKKLVLNKNTAKTLKVNTDVKTGATAFCVATGNCALQTYDCQYTGACSGGFSVSIVVSRQDPVAC